MNCHNIKFPNLSVTISQFHIRIFLIVLGLSFFTFSFYIYNFLFGNHDLPGIISTGFWRTASYPLSALGRPFAHFPSMLLTNYHYLPVLTPLVDFIFLSAGAVLFCWLYDLPRNKFFYIIVSLLICISPFLFGNLYYTGWMESFAGFFLIVLAFALLKRYKGYSTIIGSSFLFYIAIGMYQVFINTISILFIFIILHDIYSYDVFTKEIKIKYIKIITAIALGGILFLITYLYLKYTGTITPSYNTELSSIKQLLDNILPIMKSSFRDYYISQLPFTQLTKFIQLTIVILGCLTLLFQIIRNNISWKKLLLMTLCILYILFFHNISAFITPSWQSLTGEWNFRAHTHGMMLVFPFFAIIVFSSKNKAVVVLGSAICIMAVWLLAVADARAQLIWKIGLDKEYALRNRILSRIEEQENFIPNKSYQYVQIGYFPNWGQFFDQDFKKSTLELARPYEYTGIEGRFFAMLMYDMKFFSLPQESQQWLNALSAEKTWLLTSAKPWPSLDSIKVTNDSIFIIMNEESLIHVRNKLQEELPLK